MMDLGPAALEIAGIEPAGSTEAESLLPALQGEPWEGRPCVFAERGRDGILQETEFMCMVRTREWKLVHSLDEPFGQLFDLASDPGEKRNLWDDPSAAARKQELLGMLREWRIRSQNQTRDWGAEWR